MPVNDFSCADKITPILMSLNNLWRLDPANGDPLAPINTLNVLSQKQGFRSQQLEAEPCVEVKGWWLQDCDNTDLGCDTTYSAATGGLGCDIPEGKPLGSECVSYTPNLFCADARSWEDQECNNELQGINLSAQLIDKSIKVIRARIAAEFANYLVANAQVNRWSGTYGNVVGTTTEFTPAEFGNLQLMHHLRITASKNQLGAFNELCIINGLNFWELALRAQTEACCEGQTSRNVLSAFPGATWDTELDEVVGTPSTFLVNGDHVGIFNFAKYDNAQRNLSNTVAAAANATGETVVSQHTGFRVADPIWRLRVVNANGVSTTRPIYYDVEYKRLCVGRDAIGLPKYKHTYFVTFSGGLFTSPQPTCNGNTGILHFVNVG